MHSSSPLSSAVMSVTSSITDTQLGEFAENPVPADRSDQGETDSDADKFSLEFFEDIEPVAILFHAGITFLKTCKDGVHFTVNLDQPFTIRLGFCSVHRSHHLLDRTRPVPDAGPGGIGFSVDDLEGAIVARYCTGDRIFIRYDRGTGQDAMELINQYRHTGCIFPGNLADEEPANRCGGLFVW